ncbi:hypothetical protein, partial [Curtobacterium luteum]|uniref:hypothetical protein n=1 Tax=Curtobacterium luteum TaxID=33881 RepID=UPI001E48ACC6
MAKAARTGSVETETVGLVGTAARAAAGRPVRATSNAARASVAMAVPAGVTVPSGTARSVVTDRRGGTTAPRAVVRLVVTGLGVPAVPSVTVIVRSGVALTVRLVTGIVRSVVALTVRSVVV